MRCEAITEKGTQCSRNAVEGGIYCRQHLKIAEHKNIETIINPNININTSNLNTNISNDSNYQALKLLIDELNDYYPIIKDWNTNWNVDILDKNIISQYANILLNNIVDIDKSWNSYKNKKIKAKDLTKIFERTTRVLFKITSFIAQLENRKLPEVHINTSSNELINNQIFVDYWSQFIFYLLFASASAKQAKEETKLIIEYFDECKTKDIISHADVKSIKTNFYDNIKLTMYVCDIHNYLDSDLIEKVHQWITNLDTLSLSQDYFVFDAEITKVKSVFAIKVLRFDNVEKNNELLHEMSVGLLVTNKYRSLIPNFSYVYGGFSCSHQRITNAQNIEYCINMNNQVQYILYEFIEGLTWRQQLKNWTQLQFLTALISLIYALDYANKENQFTHYDLHWQNIIIRNPYKKVVGIPTIVKGKMMYILSDEIPTIIDFGFAHYKYKGKNFGIYDREQAGVFPNLCFPISDIYKLLVFSCQEVSKESEVYKTLIKLLKFFTKETPEDLVKVQINPDANRFANLPPLSNLVKITNDEFADWILKEFPEVIIYESNTLPNDTQILGMD